MIIAKLEDLFAQVPPAVNLEKALHALLELRAQDLPDGRVEVDGDRIYALVQSYTTLPATDDAKYEAHRNYIDIQYIASGCEAMGWADLARMQVTKAYNAEKDVANGVCPLSVGTLVKVNAGEAAVFFPSDAHAPKLAAGDPAPLRKIVMKVKVE